MKKFFTLSLALFILSSAAFSQPLFSTVSFHSPHVSISIGKRYVESYSFTKNDKNMQLSRIDAEYNRQVKEVMNLHISAAKKVDLIQQLQRERNNKIQAINNRFFDERNKYNDNHYDRNFNRIR